MRVQIKKLSGLRPGFDSYNNVNHTYTQDGLYIIRMKNGDNVIVPIRNIDSIMEENTKEEEPNENS